MVKIKKSLKDIAAAYLAAASLNGKSAATVHNYARVVGAYGDYCRKTGADWDASATVSGWLAELRANGVSLNSAEQYRRTLGAFFGWASRREYIGDDPLAGLEPVKRERVEYDLLSRKEIAKLATADPPRSMSHASGKRNKALVLLLLLCGLRNAEVRALTVRDLDFCAGVVDVRQGKGGKRRAAPFPEAAQNAVRGYLADERPEGLPADAPLFGSYAGEDGHPGNEWRGLSSTGLLGIVRRYTEAVCGHSVTVHALRHAAASWWDDNGVLMRDVQTALGHSSIATTERVYVQVLNKSKAAQAINNALAEKVARRCAKTKSSAVMRRSNRSCVSISQP